jgi:hypothetical protein
VELPGMSSERLVHVLPLNWLFGFHRGVIVASRSQLGFPA